MENEIKHFGNTEPQDLAHSWLEPLFHAEIQRIDWVFNRFFAAFEQLKARSLSDIETTRYDWLSGYFEYLRLKVDSSLVTASLERYWQEPLQQDPPISEFPPSLRARLVRLQHWLECPLSKTVQEYESSQQPQDEAISS